MFIVAVHGGAGFHDKTSEKSIKRALKSACERSLKVLEIGGTAVKAAEEAICVLEDDGDLNAGFGSNLTHDGTVECDASIMNGSNNAFGSAGAVSGVKNPISLANKIMENVSLPQALGRIPPMMLVGRGAIEFAINSQLSLVSPASQISPNAQAEWEIWKSRLEDSGQDKSARDVHFFDRQDTVGAVTHDSTGVMAAGVSSGGLLLKHPGRIGEAAVFGAGCWANSPPSETSGMACSVSGTGEHVITSSLSRTLADVLENSKTGDTHGVLEDILANKFHRAVQLSGSHEANAGILLLSKEARDAGTSSCRLWCAFTSRSMAIAYASSIDRKPAKILRRDKPGSGDSPTLYITALPLSRDK
ncbi:N-terminal nucleophile aminohydrolase [Rickenella mellea]|uniref:N-terminal nucleophile aminohydrolase n=1 Tax=Rickenella mellea TaxID=50990 RepID=A0A4Y7QDY7_9AGAM|nr:N-terminal nucleophile aminohydrolase [Rickenella mellea]